jgi:hypothetical protein
MYFDAFTKMGYDPLHLVKVHTPLVGFTRAVMVPEGLMWMRVEFGTLPRTTSLMIDFLVVKAPLAYNVIVRPFFARSSLLRGAGMRKKDTEIPPERAFI